MNDFIVIGAGVAGLATARALAQAGLRGLVLERGLAFAEASWAGGGILSPLYPWRYAAPVQRLVQRSGPLYVTLCAELRAVGPDPELTTSGMLILDPEEVEPGRRWAVAHGVPAEVLTTKELARLEPQVAATPAALRLPDVRQVRNPRLGRALVALLRRMGIQVREASPVSRLLTEESRVTGVEVGGERLAAERVVLAAGSWSAQLLGALGLPLPVEPVKGEMLAYRLSDLVTSHVLLKQGRYAVPRRDGVLLVGSTMERAGFDKSATVAGRDQLMQAAAELVPALAGRYPSWHWAGLRPGSPSGVPFIGEVPGVAGLYLNTGHFRNGLATAPAAAELLADLVLDRAARLDPAPYAPPG